MGTTTATAARPTFDVPRLSLSEVAAMPSEQLQEMLAESASAQASLAGLISLALAELSRRQAFRAEGATSAEAWMVERTGVGRSSARTWAGVGERLFDLPHLSEALCSGAVPLDKVRVVAAVATPETDAAWAEAAAEHSVRDLKELVRSERPPTRADAHKEYEARSLRFNEALRTMTAQLPAESFAEVRACLEARAKALGSDGETPWDQRLADALMALVRDSGSSSSNGPARSRYTVVAHVPLETLLDESSELCGELERGGLISGDVVRRLACEAEVIVAVDDDAGHTMYEGRQSSRRHAHPAPRDPAPGPALSLPWLRPRGLLDPPPHQGLAPTWAGPTWTICVCVCAYHHNLIHSSTLGWTVTGDPNVELTFVGPERPGDDLAPVAAVDQGDGAAALETPGEELSLVERLDQASNVERRRVGREVVHERTHVRGTIRGSCRPRASGSGKRGTSRRTRAHGWVRPTSGGGRRSGGWGHGTSRRHPS